jgi:deoxyhypusine synthase
MLIAARNVHYWGKIDRRAAVKKVAGDCTIIDLPPLRGKPLN